jgi:hypothetical protein
MGRDHVRPTGASACGRGVRPHLGPVPHLRRLRGGAAPGADRLERGCRQRVRLRPEGPGQALANPFRPGRRQNLRAGRWLRPRTRPAGLERRGAEGGPRHRLRRPLQPRAVQAQGTEGAGLQARRAGGGRAVFGRHAAGERGRFSAHAPRNGGHIREDARQDGREDGREDPQSVQLQRPERRGRLPGPGERGSEGRETIAGDLEPAGLARARPRARQARGGDRRAPEERRPRLDHYGDDQGQYRLRPRGVLLQGRQVPAWCQLLQRRLPRRARAPRQDGE